MMGYSKLTKQDLLKKCEEMGITDANPRTKKQELIDLIQNFDSKVVVAEQERDVQLQEDKIPEKEELMEEQPVVDEVPNLSQNEPGLIDETPLLIAPAAESTSLDQWQKLQPSLSDDNEEIRISKAKLSELVDELVKLSIEKQLPRLLSELNSNSNPIKQTAKLINTSQKHINTLKDTKLKPTELKRPTTVSTKANNGSIPNPTISSSINSNSANSSRIPSAL